jgi:outer membrane protein
MLMLIPCSLYAEAYSLHDLFVSALQKSEVIKIAEEDINISEHGKDKILAQFSPTLSAFGEHTRYSESKYRSTTLLQPDYTNEWGTRIDQTLSLGGKEFTALRKAKKGVEKSRLDLDSVKEEYMLDVALQYYLALRANREVEIAGANLERLTKHRDASKKRLEVGNATKTVLLRAEAELAGAKSEMIMAENDLKISKTRLAKTAGISGSYDLKEPEPGIDSELTVQDSITREFMLEECGQSTLDCLQKMAFSNRAEIKSMAIKKKMAEDEVQFRKGSYWPDLSLEGVYVKQENEPSTSFGLEEKIYGVVKLDIPIFEGGLTRAEVSEARAKLRQTEYSFADLRKTVGVEVENSYLLVIREASVLEHLKAETEYAMDNYNVVTKQFKFGLSDSIDIIDANTLLVTSERKHVNTEYVYQLALLRLKRVTGILLSSVRGDN